ncbi:MAG TPA: dihydrodipicolinate synthase family protein [Acidobacteriaceae bacterium]|nr:dihydrodipicolinate synthase family protein [Acidobacteriaceae bacterium]
MSPVAPDTFTPRGVYAPTITAFEKTEDVSLPGTRAFVRFLVAQGVDGLVPLGSSGEPLSLTIDERKAILEAVTEEAVNGGSSLQLLRNAIIGSVLEARRAGKYPLSRAMPSRDEAIAA